MTEQEFGIAWAKLAEKEKHKAKLPPGKDPRDDFEELIKRRDVMNKRRKVILDVIKCNPGVTKVEIRRIVLRVLGPVSKETIKDDLRHMSKNKKCHQLRYMGGYYFGPKTETVE